MNPGQNPEQSRMGGGGDLNMEGISPGQAQEVPLPDGHREGDLAYPDIVERLNQPGVSDSELAILADLCLLRSHGGNPDLRDRYAELSEQIRQQQARGVQDQLFS